MLAGRYRRLDRIGRGGMGSVWRAHDADLDREVAIKELWIPEQVGEQERAVWYARMEREARAAARLRHPGIVTVYDRVMGDDGRPWIVMELVRGRSLDRALAEDGALPARRVAEIGLAMLDALSAAHAQGIVHRDVKPANVLLEGPRVLLTDFGIAAVEGDATLTRSGTVLGTPAYMSPEQVEGRPVTDASDLWSLGATLYAAVEGNPPFTAPTHGALFVAIATREPDAPRCGGPLAEVLSGLLRKDPADRPSPARVRELLAAAAAGERFDADPGPTRPVTRVDTVPVAADRASGPVAEGRDYTVAVRGALACTWITVAVTLVWSWQEGNPMPAVLPHWIPAAVGCAVVLSAGLWSATRRPVLTLATVAVINVSLTAVALAGLDWGDESVRIGPDAAFAWVGGAAALAFAVAGTNRLLEARVPPAWPLPVMRGPIVLIEGAALTTWPWLLFETLGVDLRLSTEDDAVQLFVGSLALVFLAWFVTQLIITRPDPAA
ncbi:hypothetical protein GCM10010182_65150 [Actinomadura cremea]|nr:hypothetical protein GCM10010182_65150 [Actinomadura cremea]